MATETKIEWATHSASPWYGCAHAAYKTKECANSWRKFCKAAWHANRSRVVKIQEART
jgi:hypothetical protein